MFAFQIQRHFSGQGFPDLPPGNEIIVVPTYSQLATAIAQLTPQGGVAPARLFRFGGLFLELRFRFHLVSPAWWSARHRSDQGNPLPPLPSRLRLTGPRGGGRAPCCELAGILRATACNFQDAWTASVRRGGSAPRLCQKLVPNQGTGGLGPLASLPAEREGIVTQGCRVPFSSSSIGHMHCV